MSTQIKQGLLLKKYQLQITNAIVDWVYQLQKFLKHVARELPRRKHTTFRTRQKFEIKNTSPLLRGNCMTKFNYSKNSASRKPNSSPPLPSSFTAEITTPYLVSYRPSPDPLPSCQ
jgi:hypothetical protein